MRLAIEIEVIIGRIMGLILRVCQAAVRFGGGDVGCASVDGLPLRGIGGGIGRDDRVQFDRPRRSTCARVAQVGEHGDDLGVASGRG